MSTLRQIVTCLLLLCVCNKLTKSALQGKVLVRHQDLESGTWNNYIEWKYRDFRSSCNFRACSKFKIARTLKTSFRDPIRLLKSRTVNELTDSNYKIMSFTRDFNELLISQSGKVHPISDYQSIMASHNCHTMYTAISTCYLITAISNPIQIPYSVWALTRVGIPLTTRPPPND